MDLNLHTSDNKEFSLPIKQNNDKVYNIINQASNPHPILIMIIVIIIMLYIQSVKKCFNSDWYSKDADIKICHNKWADTLSITIHQGSKKTNCMGYAVGNAIYMTVINDLEGYKFMGVFDDEKIHWLNGDIWQKAKNSILI